MRVYWKELQNLDLKRCGSEHSWLIFERNGSNFHYVPANFSGLSETIN